MAVGLGWFLVFGIKEGLVECAIVCVKSVVILLPKVIIQDQNGNGVLNRLVTYLKCMKLAC